MLCINCGYENTDESVFCVKCGNKLEQETTILTDNTGDAADGEFEESASTIKRGNRKKKITRFVIIILLLVVAVCGIMMMINIQKEATMASPDYRMNSFVTTMEAKEYETAFYCLELPDGFATVESFEEFAKNNLSEAKYTADVENKIVRIKTAFTTYELQYKEDGEDWYMSADDLTMSYKVRALSLIWHETEDKGWNLGHNVDEEYIGDGLVEFTAHAYKTPQIELFYCIEVGSSLEGTIYETSHPSVKAVINVNPNGSLNEIAGIYNAVTGEALGESSGTISENVFTVEKYMFGPNYLDSVADDCVDVMFDMADDVLAGGESFDIYQSNNESKIANTENLRELYNAFVSARLELELGAMPDQFQVLEYNYNVDYYCGTNYYMTIQAQYMTDTTYKLNEQTIYATLYPGEYGLVVHELNAEE